MEHRNRAQGWKYAKLTGHENEKLIKEFIDNNKEYSKQLLERIHINGEIIKTSIGGINEKDVESVNNRKTKSKTDLKLFLNTQETLNISIKKSLGGQVYFVSAKLFVQTYERQFNKTVPEDVKKAINLFWASDPDAIELIETYADKSDIKNYNMQIRHKSLNATTLKNYNLELYNCLINWIRENIYEITILCFASGAVKDKNEWSKFIWYKNMLGENDIDDIFVIDDICNQMDETKSQSIFYSDKNGGTTIQLPFGFLQWHQGQMQFHHDYKKLKNYKKN